MTGSALFGGLLGDAATRDAFSATAFLDQMLGFERAWTEALITCTEADAETAQAARAALDRERLDIAALGSASARDGLPVPELVRQLRAGLAEDVAALIHTGATSQDVIDSALMLIWRDRLTGFAADLEALDAALAGLEARFGTRPFMARTRMQAALPATIALRLGAWRAALATCRGEIAALRQKTLVVQIGGPIGTAAVDPRLPALVAEALGLAPAPVWHSNRQTITTIGHWLMQVSGTLGKIGQDVALMAQSDEITLAGAGGSSAMAHKRNPVLAETLVALGRWVAGQQGLLGQSLIHEQERSGAAWTLEWLVLPAMIEACATALRHAHTLTGTITAMGEGG